jgi:hypothetical protein
MLHAVAWSPDGTGSAAVPLTEAEARPQLRPCRRMPADRDDPYSSTDPNLGFPASPNDHQRH